jgi:hypothetical protein
MPLQLTREGKGSHHCGFLALLIAIDCPQRGGRRLRVSCRVSRARLQRKRIVGTQGFVGPTSTHFCPNRTQPRPPPGDCPSAPAPHLAQRPPLSARCGPSPHPHSSRAAIRGLRRALSATSGHVTTRKPEPPARASLPAPRHSRALRPGTVLAPPHSISHSACPSRRVVDRPPTRTLAAQPPADS